LTARRRIQILQFFCIENESSEIKTVRSRQRFKLAMASVTHPKEAAYFGWACM
jgi:hypothetical protein